MCSVRQPLMMRQCRSRASSVCLPKIFLVAPYLYQLLLALLLIPNTTTPRFPLQPPPLRDTALDGAAQAMGCIVPLRKAAGGVAILQHVIACRVGIAANMLRDVIG